MVNLTPGDMHCITTDKFAVSFVTGHAVSRFPQAPLTVQNARDTLVSSYLVVQSVYLIEVFLVGCREVLLQSQDSIECHHRKMERRWWPSMDGICPSNIGHRWLVAEHMAVRTGVGIFDVSHMGDIASQVPRRCRGATRQHE